MAELFRGYTQQELADAFAEAGAGAGPVALLKCLATGRFSLNAGREQIVRFLGPNGRELIDHVDFGTALQHFANWFLALVRAEPLPASIRALNFGLFESSGGCKLYVTGANAYDPQDSDWACANDWTPERRYAPVELISEVYGLMCDTEAEPWVGAQAAAILLIRALFEMQRAEIQDVLGKRKLFIASGFDDGDLFLLKTAFSPKA